MDADVASFVGEANLLDGVARGSTVETGLGSLTLVSPAGPGSVAVTVLVRPEQLDVELDPSNGDGSGDRVGGAGRGGLHARVRSCDHHGHDTTVRLGVEAVAGLPETLVARVPGSLAVRLSDAVLLRVSGAVEAWAVPAAPPVPARHS